jgi:multiple sugar transport system permease protein/raffinose/stachyose/melibiose transport system permease protein
MHKNKLTYRNFWFYIILIAPLAAVYIIFFIIPVFQSMFYSFTNFNGLNPTAKFVGFKNYKYAFTDSKFLDSVGNTVFQAVGVTVIQNILALVVALGLNKKFKARGLMRTLIFAPCMLAPVVVAYLWQFIYSPEGLLNGIVGGSKVWLADENFAPMGIVLAHTWIWLGYTATIYLANLQSISADINEAAVIDGCEGFKLFRYITFPMLAPSFTINVSLAFTGSLKIFDLVYAMTDGGPNGATETMSTYVFRKMSNNLDGYASALTVLMMIFIVIFGQILTQTLQKREEEIV